MIDLDKVNIFKKDTIEPVVAQVWINKQTPDLRRAQARLLASGFSIEKAEENEEAYIYVQVDKKDLPDGPNAAVAVVKLDEEISAICVVEKSYMPDFDGTNFAETVKTANLFPGIHTAMDALSTTLGNVIFDAGSHGEAVKQAEKLLGDFSKHVAGLVKSIPPTAFKLEDMREGAAAKIEWLVKAGEPEDANKPTDEPGATKDEPEGDDTLPSSQDVLDGKAPGKEAGPSDEEGQTHDSKYLETAEGLVRKATEELGNDIGTKLTAVLEAVKGLGERVEQVESASADNARKTTSLARKVPLADDLQTDASTYPEDGDEDNDVPYFDSAYMESAESERTAFMPK